MASAPRWSRSKGTGGALVKTSDRRRSCCTAFRQQHVGTGTCRSLPRSALGAPEHLPSNHLPPLHRAPSARCRFSLDLPKNSRRLLDAAAKQQRRDEASTRDQRTQGRTYEVENFTRNTPLSSSMSSNTNRLLKTVENPRGETKITWPIRPAIDFAMALFSSATVT